MRELLKNRVVGNALWIILANVVQSLVALVIGLITARYLGPSNYGLINYAASIVAFVVPIMNLGFSNVLVQELTNNPTEEGKILGSAILLSVFSSFACILGISVYTYAIDVSETITHYVVILYSVMLIFQALGLISYQKQRVNTLRNCGSADGRIPSR